MPSDLTHRWLDPELEVKPPRSQKGSGIDDWHCACGAWGNFWWEGYARHLERVAALADELAEALNGAALDAHAYGPVRDHWLQGPEQKTGDGPCPFDQCQDRFCTEARELLTKWKASGK